MTITKDTTVTEVLERLPETIYLFEEHGVNPAKHCGPMLRVTRLAETPSLCRIEDLDGLIDKLNTALGI